MTIEDIVNDVDALRCAYEKALLVEYSKLSERDRMLAMVEFYKVAEAFGKADLALRAASKAAGGNK